MVSRLPLLIIASIIKNSFELLDLGLGVIPTSQLRIPSTRLLIRIYNFETKNQNQNENENVEKNRFEIDIMPIEFIKLYCPSVFLNLRWKARASNVVSYARRRGTKRTATAAPSRIARNPDCSKIFIYENRNLTHNDIETTKIQTKS